MFPSKFIYSENIRNRKDLGCHLMQPPHITDEATEAQRKEVNFPRKLLTCDKFTEGLD